MEKSTSPARAKKVRKRKADGAARTSKYFEKPEKIEKNMEGCSNAIVDANLNNNCCVCKSNESCGKESCEKKNFKNESGIHKSESIIEKTDTAVIFRKLTRVDYRKSSLDLAKYLLGKIIIRIDNEQTMSARIVETEAYLGEADKACHTYGGKCTARTKPMYMAEGYSYVYSIYGIYYCLNISSLDIGGCVLIRALQPIQGTAAMVKYRGLKRKENSPKLKEHQLCNGPSKLCQAMNVTKHNLNAVDMTSSSNFYLACDGLIYNDDDIVICKRIGISGYGEETASKPYRFYVRGNKNVSVKDKVAENSLVV